MDRLYQETIDQYYGLGVNETDNTLEPRDDASSSSIVQESDFVVLNLPSRNLPDQRPHEVSRSNFILDPMTEVKLRKVETGTRSHQ